MDIIARKRKHNPLIQGKGSHSDKDILKGQNTMCHWSPFHQDTVKSACSKRHITWNRQSKGCTLARAESNHASVRKRNTFSALSHKIGWILSRKVCLQLFH